MHPAVHPVLWPPHQSHPLLPEDGEQPIGLRSCQRRAATEFTPNRSRPKTRDDPSRSPLFGTRSKSGTNMVTPEEYDSLPPSIQKKYFSSVERLRIAQKSAAQKRKKQATERRPQNEPWLSPKPSMEALSRPKTAHSFRSSVLTSSLPPRTARSERSEADVDEEQALRFLALPDKVKRSHFTPEELLLLTESSERALASACISDNGLSSRTTTDRKASIGPESIESIGSSLCRSSVSDGMVDDIDAKDWLDVDAESIGSLEYGEEIVRFYARKGSISSMHSLAPTVTSGMESRRKSFSRKRAIKLAPIPLPPPTLLPAVPPLPSPTTLSNLNKLVQLPAPATTPTETAPQTKYYKDSHARQKLREYLASPEKFDEALEFGFSGEQGLPMRSSSLASHVERSAEDEDEGLSAAGSKDDEDEAAVAGSPRTPSVVNEVFTSIKTPHSSLDSGVVLPYTPGRVSGRCTSPTFDGREMTLRMTLTRPDLRAPEEELYAFQRREVSGVDVASADPLALETLPVCNDHTGAHGAFAVRQGSRGGFKQVWKNIRGKSS
ncbi:hypothetical protein DOTSEDRAFT_68687 [Dothistroma septosporum NZE10]|uniref:Uncharacterized protein n=1 Tax=Dothistroma septosporum (strain NZE10 / CBS 128990) TaxID=675120 RepID=N1Q3Y8_DOTSN|nr:hypothetical protein DOTSEDRAFT_68687 [Dothistroma septosporum NZE10]